MLHAAVVASMPHANCFKGNPIVRVVTLTADRYPESAKSLRLGKTVVDVQVLILPDGTRCGPKIVKTSGNLAIDNAAYQEAYRSYLQSVKANAGKSDGTYLYHIRFSSP